MRKVSLGGVSLIIFLILPQIIIAGAWYTGGTLHKANVSQWNQASYSNKLATAADWAITQPNIKAIVRRSDSMDALKPYAEQLVTCVNEAATVEGYETTDAVTFAAACAVLMGWR